MKQLVRLLKRDWPYLTGLAVVFFLAILGGRALPELMPDVASELEKQTMTHFKNIAQRMQGLGVLGQIRVILINNVVASLSAMVMGLLMIPGLPILLLIGNGLIIGLVQHLTAAEGLSTANFFLALVPHGIFEIPGFLIAIYLGVRFSLLPYRLLWHYYRTNEHRPLLKEYLRELPYYFYLLISLLLVAAVVEMTISPLLL